MGKYSGTLTAASTAGIRSGVGTYFYTPTLIAPPPKPKPPPPVVDVAPVEGAPIVHREVPTPPPLVAPDPDCFYKYSGSWRNGVKDGKGEFTLRDCSVYTGEFLGGEITGEGRRVYANGREYVGGWENGEKEGWGTERFGEEVYEGNWHCNRRCGPGKITWSGGDYCEGVFEGHQMRGKGVARRNGLLFKGTFERGQPTGRGVGKYLDGGRDEVVGEYEGEYVEGRREGEGRYDCKVTGITYTGPFSLDAPALPPVGLLALFDTSAAPEAAKGKGKPKVKGKKGKGDEPDPRPELTTSPGGDVPAVFARAVADFGGHLADTEAPSMATSTTSLALAPEPAKCESGRAIRLTFRKVDEEAKAAYDAGVEDGSVVPAANAIPEFVTSYRIPFRKRLPSVAQVSTGAPRWGTLKTVSSGLVAFYETVGDAVGGDGLAADVGEVGGQECVSGPFTTPDLAGFDTPENGAAVTIDFYLPEEPPSPDTPATALFSSQFLTLSLNNGSFFQLTTPESSWSLPPPAEGISRGAWHSLGVTMGSGGGLPGLVLDGQIISGGSVSEEKGTLAPLSPKKERAIAEGSSEESVAAHSVTVSAGAHVKNLGVWSCGFSAASLLHCTGVYGALLAASVLCSTTQNDAVGKHRASVEARAARAQEAAEKEEEAPVEEEELGEEPVFVEGCNEVGAEGLVEKTAGGEAMFENMVMTEGVEPGCYAIVVEDEGGEGYFQRMVGGGMVLINIA